MNALTDQYVRQHLQELRDEAATRRRFQSDRPSLFRRIATAVSSARQHLAVPMIQSEPNLTKVFD